MICMRLQIIWEMVKKVINFSTYIGHYTSYVNVECEGKDYWLNFDDDVVRPIS